MAGLQRCEAPQAGTPWPAGMSKAGHHQTLSAFKPFLFSSGALFAVDCSDYDEFVAPEHAVVSLLS